MHGRHGLELTPNTFDERPQLACDGDYRGQASIVLLEMTPTLRQGATFVALASPPTSSAESGRPCRPPSAWRSAPRSRSQYEVFRTPHEKPGLVRDAGDVLANNARLAEGIAQKILPFPDLEVPLIAVQFGDAPLCCRAWRVIPERGTVRSDAIAAPDPFRLWRRDTCDHAHVAVPLWHPNHSRP